MPSFSRHHRFQPLPIFLAPDEWTYSYIGLENDVHVIAIADAGFGGVMVLNLDSRITRGGVDCASEEQFGLLQYAVALAADRGVQMNNALGYPSEGGP